MRCTLLTVLMTVVALTLGACAGVQRPEPLQVTVAGIESLPGEGLEWRMMVKLRVQNPNPAPIEYDGVFLKLDVLDKTVATGVSNQRGSISRYGESVIGVPLTVSTLRVVTQALGIFGGSPPSKIPYKLEGKLDGPAFGATRFQSRGELAPPGAASS